MEESILILFRAYSERKLTKEQQLVLSEWLKAKPERKKIFTDFQLLYKKTQRVVMAESIDGQNAWKKILKSISNYNPIDMRIITVQRKRDRKLAIARYTAICASIAMVLCVSILLLSKNLSDKTTSIVSKESSIIIKLCDGTSKLIAYQGKQKIMDAEGRLLGIQRGGLIDYTIKSDKGICGKNEYNELIVPYGKTFDLLLSDGTYIKLNAGSSVRYPIQFLSGTKREVFLKGEAYFDVATHKYSPFVVSTEEVDIRVLGTRFNVSSYPEDDEINTVLEEGFVNIYTKVYPNGLKSVVKLKPNQKADWNKKNKNMSVKKVNPMDYLAWMDGKLVLRNASFEVMKKRIERKYDLTIINNNKILESGIFNATFNTETIEDIMEIFSINFNISYKITHKRIIIN